MPGFFDPEKAFDQTCTENLRKNASNAALKILAFYAMVIICNLFHHLLRPWSQPRITSDLVIGLTVGNIGPIKNWIVSIPEALDSIVHFGMICYMFVLGLEMDPYVLFKWPNRAAKVAYAGMLSTFILASTITPFFQFFKVTSIMRVLSLSTALSGTASPVLTRVITSQKIGKSDIGQLVIAAGMHSDFVSTLLISVGYIAFQDVSESNGAHIKRAIIQSIALFVQSVLTALVSPFFLNWVNNENPEGKPLKGSHLVLSVAFMVLVCSCSTLSGYSPILSAFMAGIFMPREGRVSKWALGKINYFLTSIFYPIFFFWMGYEADFKMFEPGHLMTWARLVILLLIVTAGKVAGIIISGAILGFNWPESVMIGLLLTVKGHFHIFLALVAKQTGKILPSASIGMILVIFFTVVHAPSVVANIIKRARKRSPTHRMALQWLDPSSELRMLLCLRGPQDVSSIINFMEISRGTADPGMVVYVTDMIELTDQIAATLVHGEMDSITVTDKAVTEMRDQITSAVQSFVEDNGDGITLRRMLALSPFSIMPRDICNLAEDLLISLIILPFHKCQRADGTFDAGHPGFRFVNRKMLRHAPCSVGILVDRGFGLTEKISGSYVSLNIAVIFIGGKDDREALAYAGRVAWHAGVKLTVIRFLVQTDEDISSRRASNYRYNAAEQEQEMKLDDEFFANFYEKHVAGGPVAYSEKHLANSAETFSTLKSLEGQYSLIIVGRGGRVNSVLTVGMNDLEQCPELGPIGDVLSGSDFSISTSILIIQQPNLRGELEGLDEDFSIM
ncbi:cation/H(+) antiporter 28 [Eucalyptus grandis]|uniref:cation/H(+) antiporter 28 n=1 Tax=Eucalyptus grandis TaxID=71139 RepID=UPI00192EBB32|nr:cation/H(+) antiporter 28 [Eucalyptus grandis]